MKRQPVFRYGMELPLERRIEDLQEAIAMHRAVKPESFSIPAVQSLAIADEQDVPAGQCISAGDAL